MQPVMTAEQFARNYLRAMSEGADPSELPFADRVTNFYAHTAEEHEESGTVRAAYTAQMGRVLPTILKDFAILGKHVDVVSDQVAFARLIISGVLPSGEKVMAAQCSRFTLVDGKVAHVDGYIDQNRNHAMSEAMRALQNDGQAVFSELTVTVAGW